MLKFPSGRSAEEIVVDDAAGLAWVANLGCIDLNPHPVRADDLDHPDELRVDLDPVPGVDWAQIVRVALVAREVLADFGLTGWPKTSGSRGIHIYAGIEPRWTFTQVRRAAVALAREIERRAPQDATARWWKEERHGVFVDYNQNAKDRTVASAYSVRPTPDARVSAPLTWDEVPDCDPAEFTIDTMPERYAAAGRRGGGHRRVGRVAGAGCWSWPSATRPPGCRTRRGRRTTRSRRARKPGSSPRSAVRPARRAEPRPCAGDGASVVPPAPGKTSGASGRRRTSMPLIEVARAATKDEALAGLDRWKAASPGGGRGPGAGRHPGRLDARPLVDLDPDPAEPAPRPRGRAPAPGGTRGRLRPLGRGHSPAPGSGRPGLNPVVAERVTIYRLVIWPRRGLSQDCEKADDAARRRGRPWRGKPGSRHRAQRHATQ